MPNPTPPFPSTHPVAFSLNQYTRWVATIQLTVAHPHITQGLLRPPSSEESPRLDPVLHKCNLTILPSNR